MTPQQLALPPVPPVYPQVPGFKVAGTSQLAAESMRPTADTIRAQCLASLRKDGPGTADEVAARIGRTPGGVRPRFTEMDIDGLIEKTGITRKNVSGRMANEWRAV